jgi:hypothetical protein
MEVTPRRQIGHDPAAMEHHADSLPMADYHERAPAAQTGSGSTLVPAKR